MSKNYKKIRRFNQGWHSIDKISQKVFRPLIKSRGSFSALLSLDWPLIVGDFLSSQTYPDRVYFSKKEKTQGILKLLVKSSFSHEIPFYKKAILDKINAYFGYNMLADLKVQQVYDLPVRPKKDSLYGRKITDEQVKNSEKFNSIYQDLSDIKDDRLREVLSELGYFLKKD